MKNIVNIYFSPTENTKKILNAVSYEIGNIVNSIDITLPQARKESYSFTTENTIVCGVPVYGGRVPRMLTSFIKNISGNGAKAVAVVTYGNRDYEDSLLELTNLLTAQGFKVIAAAAFIGEHSSTDRLGTNRPDEKDIQIAKSFGKEVAESTFERVLEVKGNFPYVEKESPLPPMAPDTNDNCVQCKICAKTCPTGAISIDDCKEVTLEKCIKCRSCVKKCPKKAKDFTHPGYKKMQEMLEQNFAQKYKVPDLFLSK